MKLAGHFNAIIEAVTPGGLTSDRSSEPVKSFGVGVDGFSFVGENYQIYEANLRFLFECRKSIHVSYTVSEFEKRLIGFLYSNFSAKLLLDEAQSQLFFKELEAVQIEDYSVFREIHGVVLRSFVHPFELGPFTIYHFVSHRHLIEMRASVSLEFFWKNNSPSYLIEVVVKARHSEKAEELADRLFEKFELCLRFSIGFNSNRYEVGILNYHGWRHRKAYILSAGGSASSSHRNHGAFEYIPIDDKYFTESESGFDRMWEGVKSNNPSELQKRLLLAIEWVGQAYGELSPPSAFLKAAIALEILFTQNEKTLVSASILNQISESVALILGDNVEERIKIEAELKRLYSMRSAIAHSGKTDVVQDDLFSIFSFCRQVIITIMVRPTLRDLRSISEIHAYLKTVKYSCAEI